MRSEIHEKKKDNSLKFPEAPVSNIDRCTIVGFNGYFSVILKTFIKLFQAPHGIYFLRSSKLCSSSTMYYLVLCELIPEKFQKREMLNAFVAPITIQPQPKIDASYQKVQLIYNSIRFAFIYYCQSSWTCEVVKNEIANVAVKFCFFFSKEHTMSSIVKILSYQPVFQIMTDVSNIFLQNTFTCFQNTLLLAVYFVGPFSKLSNWRTYSNAIRIFICINGELWQIHNHFV